MGKGRERIRSDRRASKANAASKSRKPPTSSAKSASVRPSRAANPKQTKGDEPGGNEQDNGGEQFVKHENGVEGGLSDLGHSRNERDDDEAWFQQDEQARRSSFGNERSSSLSNDALQGRASLMLEIMEPKSSTSEYRPLADQSGRVSTAPVWRPPRRTPVSQDGTPDPYAFARDELIAPPHGLWAHGGEADHSAAVTGVSVSQVEQDELKLLEHFADNAMELDEKQLSRMGTPLNDQAIVPMNSTAKQPSELPEVKEAEAEVEAEGQSSPGGAKGQKRQRSDDPAQFSPELELIGGEGSDSVGNKEAKRVALDNGAGGQDAASPPAVETKQEKAAEVAAPVAAPTTAPAAVAPSVDSGAASDPKAHSPAVSPVDCEGSMGQADGSAQAAAAAATDEEQSAGTVGGKADGVQQQSSRSHPCANTSPSSGSTEPPTGVANEEGGQQASPSAFRRLSSRAALNLG